MRPATIKKMSLCFLCCCCGAGSAHLYTLRIYGHDEGGGWVETAAAAAAAAEKADAQISGRGCVNWSPIVGGWGDVGRGTKIYGPSFHLGEMQFCFGLRRRRRKEGPFLLSIATVFGNVLSQSSRVSFQPTHKRPALTNKFGVGGEGVCVCVPKMAISDARALAGGKGEIFF